ncbi:MAG: ketoacyl-ACP synthase III [Desulfobacteraceae bacterium]|nr:MAG: ketoacyl-ACP synthase III [Desulfobacteraceae bacterium]
MATAHIKGARIAAIGTCVPSHLFDNLNDTKDFTPAEIRKVVAMAGVQERRLADETICSTDLCVAAAGKIIAALNWEPQTVDAVILVTQTPDYFLPSSSCLIHKQLGLSENCAAFDIGLGCSGYPYGLWMAAMMCQTGGFQRVIFCHGDTPGRFSLQSDRSVALLFGDAGSATAIEAIPHDASDGYFFSMHTDGNGYKDMIIEGGGFRDRFPDDRRKHYVNMNGANIFNFTIKRLPPLIMDTLKLSGHQKEDVDYFIFHQSNQYILRHVMKKLSLPEDKTPMTLKKFGNPGGPSIPLTLTNGGLSRPKGQILKLMLLGYGVGLSWASALIELDSEVLLEHMEISHGRSL